MDNSDSTVERNTPSSDSSNETPQITQHHVSPYLEAVLTQEPPPDANSGKRMRYPLFMDCLLACGLLVAVGGFTIGLLKMYIVHKAQQCIVECNFKDAIAIIDSNPLPGMFNIDNNNSPNELLSQALYLDAMKRIDEDNDTKGGMDELRRIRAGSHYFTLAQAILAENFEPSAITLQCGIEQKDAAAGTTGDTAAPANP